MPTQKSANVAAPKRTTKARAAKPANQTKTTHTHDQPAPSANAPDGFFEGVVAHMKEFPAQVGHVFETVGDVATAAAKQTSSIVSDIAEKTGIRTTKKAVTKKTVSRSTRRRRRK